ncbi:hypothetical protein L208DRAFT_210848 [Tricholoma matsutake]|nr:hypothetical protein L208DRAFT_210848 [Tricholoma matsutake 945]
MNMPPAIQLSRMNGPQAHGCTHPLRPHIKRSDEPCGLCLWPMDVCKFYLKWGKGAGVSDQVDFAKSTCIKSVPYVLYVVISEHPRDAHHTRYFIYSSSRCIIFYHLLITTPILVTM